MMLEIYTYAAFVAFILLCVKYEDNFKFSLGLVIDFVLVFIPPAFFIKMAVDIKHFFTDVKEF